MCTSCTSKNRACQYYIQDYNIEFKIINPKKGERYEGRKFPHNSIVFMLEGEVMYSYNDFLNHHFKKGDLLFLPQSSEIVGIALTDAKMMILNFNNNAKNLCDSCFPANYSDDIKSINYAFRPLPLTPTLITFADLIEKYISSNIKCRYLHELKQKELFVIMGASYNIRDLLELFYPISGGNFDFKTRVMESYDTFKSVNELAKKFGMCYTSFLRKFKAEFGETVQEWMLKEKAKHIKLRLSLPETTIADILTDFNFTDAPHFTKYCKKQYGCTPTELIKELRRR